MSVEAMAAVLKLQGLDPADKLLLVGIANHDGDGGAWPSVDTLATYLGKSTRTVQRRLRALEAAGLITCNIGAGGTTQTRSDRRPTLYLLHFDGVTQDDTPLHPRGDKSDADGVTELCHPNHPLEPSLEEPLTDQSTAEVPALDLGEPEAKEPEQEWDSLFEAFWNKYPRKDSRATARQRFGEMVRRGDLLSCRYGFRKWRQHWERENTRKKYIPMASGWLYRRYYLDDPLDEEQPNGPVARLLIEPPTYEDHGYAMDSGE